MLPSFDDRRLNPAHAMRWRRRSGTLAQPESVRRPPLAVVSSALEVSESVTPNGIERRAQLPLGRGRYGDAARIAHAFTSLAVRVTETSSTAEHSHVTTGVDSAGNTIVELRSPGAGIPKTLVTGLLQPVIEAHVESCLERGRMLAPDANLTMCVDLDVARPLDGGMALRVVLYLDATGLPPLGHATRDADLTETPAGSIDAEPRRFASGFHRAHG